MSCVSKEFQGQGNNAVRLDPLPVLSSAGQQTRIAPARNCGEMLRTNARTSMTLPEVLVMMVLI